MKWENENLNSGLKHSKKKAAKLTGPGTVIKFFV